MQCFGNGLSRDIAVEDMAFQHTRVLVAGHKSKIPARRNEHGEPCGKGSKAWSFREEEGRDLPVSGQSTACGERKKRRVNARHPKKPLC